MSAAIRTTPPTTSRAAEPSRDDDRPVSGVTRFVAIEDLADNRRPITDHDHRPIKLTLDLNVIFAPNRPAPTPVTGLPYPRGIDATSSLRM